MNYRKAYEAIRYGEKLPRKTKKLILGKLITKKELRKKIQVIKESAKDVFELLESGKIESLFCPKCGCTETRTIYHAVEWPEAWNQTYCARCDNEVARQDNSPTYHVLELKELSF